jgi:predicted transcriptional regulator
MTLSYLGMNYNVPRQVKLDALIMKEKQVIVPQIVQSLPISKSTIYRAQRNAKKYGDVIPNKKKRGPQPSIPRGIGYVFILYQSIKLIMKQALLSMVLQVPDAYLEEYGQSLRERYNLDVSAGVIGRFLAKQGITKKKVILL